MSQIESGIYRLQNTVSGKVYIGSAANTNRRRSQHYFDLRHGKHANSHLQKSWNKHGEDAFEFKVLIRCAKEYLIRLEQEAIDDYRDTLGWEMMYNNATRAGSQLGMKHSPESIAKMSASSKGKKASPETRVKLSAMRRGRKLSSRWRANMSAAQKGRKISSEHRAKISEANQGKPAWNKGKKCPPEVREKISASLKGRKLSPDCIAKIKIRMRTPEARARASVAGTGRVPWNKDKKADPETRKKISASLKGNKNSKGKKHSPEICAANSARQKGRKASPATRAKMSAAAKGKNTWTKGKPWSPARRKAYEERKKNK